MVFILEGLFHVLIKVALRSFSTSFLSVVDIWENNASEKYLLLLKGDMEFLWCDNLNNTGQTQCLHLFQAAVL